MEGGILTKTLKAPAILFFSTLLAFSFLFLPIKTSSAETNDENLDSINRLYRLFAPKTSEITVPELLELKKTKRVILVDNRTLEEQEISMIPGAITNTFFEEKPEDYINDTIIVYCTIGIRSGKYVKKLIKDGFDAYNLKGGVLEWAHAGERFIDKTGKETNRVHVYGKRWNLLPTGYEGVL